MVYGSPFRKGKMTKFQRRAHVVLLHKHVDRTVPINYRSIFLLNVNAKSGPKILAHRLGRVLGSLLYTEKYGFDPGRDIRHAHICFKHWPNYTSIRQVRRGLFSCTLPRLLTVSLGMRWICDSNILNVGKNFVAESMSSFRALCPL